MNNKLYRCRNGRVLFGVCCGLARYFALDPVIVRIIFVLSFFIPGLGGGALLAYIILAIIIPVEGSTATTPEQTVKENLNEIRDTANELGEKIRSNVGGKVESHDERIQRRNQVLIILGIFLIALGALAIMSNLNLFWWFRWDLLGPAILIVIGVLFLISTTKRK